MASLAVCSLVIEKGREVPRPPALAGPGRFPSERMIFMADFMVSLLNLAILPFQSTNLLVIVPAAGITVVFLFSIIRCLMHGGRRW